MSKRGSTGNIFPEDAPVPKLTKGDLFKKGLMLKTSNHEPKPTAAKSSSSGPIYEVTESSFVLHSKYSDTEDKKWNREKNPNGVVPVVVHPLLVKGRHYGKPQELMMVQREGVQFCWNLHEEGKGGILAHDMGNGKQSKNSMGRSSPAIKKCLVIAPKNAVSVWKREFKHWAPKDIPCNVVVVMPGQRDGWTVVNEFMQPSSPTNVMIVSYETFVKYNTGYENYGFQKKNSKGEIGLVICDEAHVLKNPLTARVKNLKTFLSADLWIGLTGTPYQNSLEELCHLVSFFRRDIFKDGEIKKWCKSINYPLKKNNELNGIEQEHLIRLREILSPACHYRKNSFSIERHDIILCIPLDGHPHYGKQINNSNDEENEENINPAIQHELYKRLTDCLNSPDSKQIPFIEKLTYLEKACIHPMKLYEAVQKHSGIFSDLINYFDDEVPKEVLMEYDIKIRLPALSSKVTAVAEMAKHLINDFPGEKMIIVSSSTFLLEKVEDYFNKILQFEVVVYNGKTKEAERERNLKTFETDDDCRFLLLSLKAGGTALTLTRANHLVILGPDYNPSNDKQAIARIYRPSQHRTASIYRLLATGTHEEVKFLRQLEKEDMQRCVQSDGSVNIKTMYNEKKLLEYKSDVKSSLKVFLDQLESERVFNSEEFINDDVIDVTLAEELRESQQYSDDKPPGDDLKLVRKIWNFVSYAFHTSNVKVPDDIDAQRLVLSSTDNTDSI